MHKVASKACMNRLAIFKAVLAKQSIFFSKYCSKPSPNLVYTKPGENKSPSQSKSCQKSQKMNFCHQNPVTVTTKHFTQLPPPSRMKGTSCHIGPAQQCWKKSSFCIKSRLRGEDAGDHARSECFRQNLSFQRVNWKRRSNKPYSINTGAILDCLGSFCSHLFHSIVGEYVNDREEVDLMVVRLTQPLN